MHFVYAPEGADPRKWEFNPGKLMSPEIEVIERNTGMPYVEWVQQVTRGSVTALHGLLFVLLKRSAPTLKWGDVQFCLEDVGWEMSDEETAAMIAELQAQAESKGLDPDEQEYLDMLLAQQPATEDANPEVAAPLEG